MKSLYVVTVRWVNATVNPPLLDAALGEVGDWLRFNAETWFLMTAATPLEVRDLVIKHLTHEDNCLVLPLELLEAADGWAPQWVWDWLRSRAIEVGADRGYSPLPPPVLPSSSADHTPRPMPPSRLPAPPRKT